MHAALDHILRFETFTLHLLLNMQKYPNVTERSHIHFSSIFVSRRQNKLPFVNEFSVKFAFVFVHDSCLFLLNSSFLPYFVTFYMSLLHVLTPLRADCMTKVYFSLD